MKYITLQLSTNQTTMASIINNSQKSCYKNKFKIAAVALAEKPGYSNRKAARELGIAEVNIRTWKKILPAILAASRSKCITKSRRGAKWPNIEKRMRDYIDDRRARGIGVSRVQIRLEALKVARELKITDFKSSEGWCSRFMKRNEYCLRAPTNIAQKLPAHYVEKITSFQRFVIKERTQINYDLQHIGNMDETPVYMDMLPGKTVNKKGQKSIIMKSTGHEKNRYTVVLTVMADGTKLKPFIIFKRAKVPSKLTFPAGVIIHCNEKGWMDEIATKIWVEKVWQRRPMGLFKPPSLLVWDKFSAHLTEGVVKKVRETGTHVAVIPGGLTSMLQPLDVSINKPFKDKLRELWMEWMASDQYSLTTAGNMRAPPLDTCAKWVDEAWKSIKVPIIVKSFKKCCISNALDGTEDDMLWEDNVRGNALHTDTTTEVDDPREPYSDEIPQDIWHELFDDVDDDDDDSDTEN